MFGFNGIVNSVDKKIIKLMREKVNINPQTLEQWCKEDTEIASSIVRELAQYLFPKPEVEILEKDSAGDQYFKVDIILHFPEWTQQATDELEKETYPAYSYAFQVKTHKGQADDFVGFYGETGVSYKGQSYPCPGVIYCDAKKLSQAITVDNVKKLGYMTSSIIHPEITEAIDIINKRFIRAAKKEGPYLYLDYRPFKNFFDPWVWTALAQLKIISIGGGRIILN